MIQKKWVVLPKIKKNSQQKLRKYPEKVRQLLFNRGITASKTAESFFKPEIEKRYSVRKLHDVKKAAEFILRAVESGKKIFIHGDYDVDGICATSILWDFLHNQLRADVLPYIPSRFDEGYGMTNESLSAIKERSAELVITVDCGIKDDELVAEWKKKGLDFVVTDHHDLKVNDQKKDVLPRNALAVVHPAFPDHTYPFRDICGAAVAWKLVEMIQIKAKADCDIFAYLDLVALATVCDVMPLIDENRIFVSEGLKQMKNTTRPGLRRLISDAGIDLEEISTYHLGFILGPRLNAAGRLDHALDAVRLLCTQSPSQAQELSAKLERLNTERQRIQADIYDQAIAQIEETGLDKRLFFAWGEDWEEGVIGIVAGKICETYNRPVLIATRKDGGFTGSARSSPHFSIIDAITAQQELLERFGGHPQAAGFTVDAKNIKKFRDNLLDIADREIDDEALTRELKADLQLTPEDVNWDMFEWLEKFAPFGYKNPRPVFVMYAVNLAEKSYVGKQNDHLRISIFDEKIGKYTSGIGFRLADEARRISDKAGVDLIFTIEKNEWNGNVNLQLNVKDIREHRK